MKIKKLILKNIGPFDNAEINFEDGNETSTNPVTILTGENGTGKSIILDAIRALLLGENSAIERRLFNVTRPRIT